MSVIYEYRHNIPSLEVYPRVYYFNNRYNEILDKYRRVTGKYTHIFGNEQLDALHSIFDDGLEVRVFGENDLSPEDFVPVSPHLYRILQSMEEQDNNYPVDYILPVDTLQDRSRASRVSETEARSEAPFEISAGGSSVTVVVCHANVDCLGNKSIKKVKLLWEQVSDKIDTQLQDCFLLCRSDNHYSQGEEDEFRRQILSSIGYKIPDHRIVIGTRHDGVKNDISLLLESKCVQEFVIMNSVLQECTKGHRRQYVTSPLLETEPVARRVQDFLYSVFRSTNEETDMEYNLSLVLKCISVNALSEKYNLPVWLCNRMLDDYSFQQKMKDSFSNNTKHRLKTLSTITLKSDETEFKNVPVETILKIYSSRITSNLQKELKSVVADVERRLSQFSSAIRKMRLEVSCCLKKSSVKTSQTTEQKDHPSESVDVCFRKNILRISGVYGIGTVYGQLEIHANPGANISAIESEILKSMRKCNKLYRFTVRLIETKPELFADCQYENGKPISSLSPPRNGTLGGFVNGSDNQLYGLTCAHVVKGPNGQEHDVFIKDSWNEQCLFAKCIPNLTVSTGESAKPLIDIAAVRVVDNMKDKCIKFLKDDSGKIKQAILAEDTSLELVGTYVYKHGAMSSLTKGVVCSDDYNVLCDDDGELEYIMLIDNYEDNGDLFAVPGDSGSTICTRNEDDVNIIKTVGILSAGQFKPVGHDTPLYFSFHLNDGLGKLTAKAGGVVFTFPDCCN